MEKNYNTNILDRAIGFLETKYPVIFIGIIIVGGMSFLIKYLGININILLSSSIKDNILVFIEVFVLIVVILIINNIKYLRDSMVLQHDYITDRLKEIDNISYIENFDNIKNTIKELIDNNNSTSKDLKEVLKSVIFLTNTTRNIPSKNDLKLLFPLRSMVLFQELIECMFDYISKTKTELDATTLDINLKIIRQSIKSAIIGYKTDIYLLSKQTLSNIIEPIIDDKLKDIEESAYDIIKDTSKSIESKYYSLSALITEFDTEYSPILLDNLLLTNFIPGDGNIV